MRHSTRRNEGLRIKICYAFKIQLPSDEFGSCRSKRDESDDISMEFWPSGSVVVVVVGAKERGGGEVALAGDGDGDAGQPPVLALRFLRHVPQHRQAQLGRLALPVSCNGSSLHSRGGRGGEGMGPISVHQSKMQPVPGSQRLAARKAGKQRGPSMKTPPHSLHSRRSPTRPPDAEPRPRQAPTGMNVPANSPIDSSHKAGRGSCWGCRSRGGAPG